MSGTQAQFSLSRAVAKNRQDARKRKLIADIKSLSVPALLPAVAFCLLSGCARFDPRPLAQTTLRERATVQHGADVTVRAAVISPRDAQAHFDARLDRLGIQAVWVEVENRSAEPLWFLPAGIDRQYCPPLEIAYRCRRWGAPATNRRIEDYCRTNTMASAVAPGATQSGFAFAQFVPGALAFNVDLLGHHNLRSFAFVEEVPGFKADFNRVHFDQLYPERQIRRVDKPMLRRELEALPPTATDLSGHKPADPLNVVVIGSLESVLHAFVGSGWHLTEALNRGSSWRTFKAFLFGESYPTGPVSSLYVFGRKQDLALQQPRHSTKQRNHMRLWLTPLTFDGQPVWAGQISRDIGVRTTSHNWHLTTHKIAPDVDETRDYLVSDLILSQALARIGWVKGVGAVSADAPRHNLTGDPYFTDGLRVVLVLSNNPVTANQIQQLGWDTTSGPE